MVVHWSIKVLSVGHVPDMVILGALHVEVRNPAQFAIDVSIFRDVRVVWHPSSLDLVHLIWVVFPLGFQKDWLFRLELFVEVLSVVSMVLIVVLRWTSVEPLIPLVLTRGEHAIIGVLLHDQFGGGFSICGVRASKLSMGFEDICESLSSKRRLSIVRCHWWSQFGINYNVFCI
jgi:hypothetical protein